jgi:hypothetical protein
MWLMAILMKGVIGGALAGLATCAVAGLCARVERQTAVSALNSTSHIVWGDRAADQASASWQYTGTGIALNELALVFWGLVYEMWSHSAIGASMSPLSRGATVSALAYITDYHLIPRRFTPGFEKRLSPASLFAIYCAIAVILPVAAKVAVSLNGMDFRATARRTEHGACNR